MLKVIQLMSLWSVVGYFFLCFCSKPKNKIEAIYLLFMAGPLAWLVMIPVSLDLHFKRKRENKT